jgi:methionyl-tRNA synthetase
MDYITYDDFAKVDVRVGTILKAEVPEGSKKLIKFTIDFGELGEKVIFSGILQWFSPEDLVGIQTTFVVNLAPRKMGDFGESQGMLFAADAVIDGERRPTMVRFEHQLQNGTRLI